jgi:hypothetical protein
VPQFCARGNAQAQKRGFPQRWFEQVFGRAQASRIERRGAHRTPACGGVWRVAMKVGNAVAVDELQCSVLAEKLHHARRVV